MTKFTARLLLPIFTLWVIALPARAFVFIPGVAALAEYMGASAYLATAIDGSLALHAVVLSIGFNTSNSTTPPSAGAPRPLEVMLNPKQPLPVPAGWTAPVAPAIQPVPPSSAASTPTSFYRLGTTGATGSTAPLACTANHGTWNSFMIRCDSIPQADCVAAGFTNCQLYNNASIGYATTYTCPAGYVVNGSSCSISVPAQVKKPLDGRCLWISDGFSFPAPDPQNPDCDAQIAAGVTSAGGKYIGQDYTLNRDTNKVTVTRSDGSLLTYTVNTDNSSVVVESYPDVANKQTLNYQTNFSAPAADGTVKVSGTASGSSPGVGTAAGSASVGSGTTNFDKTGLATSSGQDAANTALGQIKGALDGTGFNSAGTADGAATTAMSGYGTSLSDKATAADAAQAGDEASLLNWFSVSLPAAACSPWVGSVHGKAFTVDWCPYADKLRLTLSWLMALYGALTIYRTIFQPKAV